MAQIGKIFYAINIACATACGGLVTTWCMVPMTGATCTEEPYDSNRITYGSGPAGGGLEAGERPAMPLGDDIVGQRQTELSS